MVVIFHIGLFGIELAAVLAKIATFIPASYTTILAWHDFKGTVWWAKKLEEEIRKIHNGDDEEDPPEGAPGATSPKPPPKPAKDATATRFARYSHKVKPPNISHCFAIGIWRRAPLARE